MNIIFINIPRNKFLLFVEQLAKKYDKEKPITYMQQESYYIRMKDDTKLLHYSSMDYFYGDDFIREEKKVIFSEKEYTILDYYKLREDKLKRILNGEINR